MAAWSSQRWTRTLAAVLASVLGATAFTVWNQSVVNEKVYTVSLAFFAVVSWLTVRWCDEPDGKSADRLLVIIAYLIGLGYTNHPAGLLVGPAVMVAIMVLLSLVILVGMGVSSTVLLRKLRRHASEVAGVMARLTGGDLGARLEISRFS